MACLFAYAALLDFWFWRIPNRLILALAASYVPIAAFGYFSAEISARGFVNPLSDIAAAALLFVIGFALWAMKLLGAGDAKLLVPVGLFVGWAQLIPFAFGLLLVGVAMLILLRLPLPFGLGFTPAGMRFDRIRQSGEIPYAVIIVASLYFAFYFRFFAA